MRLVMFEKQGRPALGARVGNEVADLAAGDGSLPHDLDGLLRLGTAGMEAAKKAAAASTVRMPLGSIKHLPPVLAPSKAIAVGLNYVDHAAESPYKNAPTYPVLFSRWPSSWVAHNEPIVRPKVSDQFDYEGELVVVIGTGGRYIPKEQALAHVAGYSLFNDGSIRDYQFKSTQWLLGKNFDRTGSFGPEFVSADELPAGAAGLQLKTRLNGEVLQNANTRDMIFDVATLVSVCSEAVALVPGDIIISGTPAGVGFARKPPIFMKPGDTCEIEIEGIGVLSNPVAGE